jgi:molybdopterin-guanine dinucleotide biosynthesis protein A
MRHDVAVVILAGGEGKRIGGDKPNRRLAGVRLIDRALDHARRWSEVVAVSMRDPATTEALDAPIVLDAPDIAGPLGGLISALRFGARSGFDRVLVIPADMPFLPRDLLDRLLSRIGDAGCAIAGSGGRLHPVCGLWRTSAVDHVAGYVADGQRSLKGFAALIGFREVEWPSDPFDPFFNINTPDDLTEAERRARN